jgi:predicted RNase H-like HicB family nuclease
MDRSELGRFVRLIRNELQANVNMSQQFDVVIEQDEDGYYVASVPRLPGCHTQARSLDELMVRIKEAILLCLEDVAEESESLEFVGVQRVSVPT